MKKLIFSLAGALILLSSDFLFAQDAQFTQFYANPIYLNPAFAGTTMCPRAVMNYRNQWPSISGTFVTYNASYDQHVDVLHGGLGAMITEDRAGQGTLNSLAVSGIYSYLLNVTKEFSVRAGIQVTYMQKSLDKSKLTFGDQIDPKKGFVYNTNENLAGMNSKVQNVDFSAGALAFSKRYFVGLSVKHLTQPNEGFITNSPLPMRITGHAGAVIPLEGKNGNASISPNIIYQYQGKFQELCLGMYFNKGPIVAGLWYRGKDAAIALIGVQTGIFRVGYSYDYTISRLSNSTAGSHEISLAMNFACAPKDKKFRTVSCPSF